MMKIALFSSKSYDVTYFTEANQTFGYDITHYESMVSDRFTYVEMEELLSRSDIISLHCPLTPETSYLINSKSLAKMKPGVMLINTSRGGLIHTHDVIESLKKSHVGYLGIDVYEQEEKLFFKDRSEEILQDDQIARLMTFPNVLITAHQAFFTREALQQISLTTLENIREFENGNELVNEIAFHN
jgi:D-lactate dehydrogenase